MRPLAIPLLSLSLVVAAPLVASAVERTPAGPRAGFTRVDQSFTEKRQEYQERAQRQMDEWGHKMSAATEDAKENGKELAADAQAELDRAWADTKDQWTKLQQAGADGWDRARTAFERASRKLQDEWNRFHAEDD